MREKRRSKEKEPWHPSKELYEGTTSEEEREGGGGREERREKERVGGA